MLIAVAWVRRGLIWEALRCAFGVLVVSAGWWHEKVSTAILTAVHDPVYVPVRRWFGHDVALRVVHLVERGLRLVLFDWLVWWIAADFLRAKWRREDGYGK